MGGGEGLRDSQTKMTPPSEVKLARVTPRPDKNEQRNKSTQTPTESARASTVTAAEEAGAGDLGRPSVSSGIDREDSGSLSRDKEGEEVPILLSSEVTVGVLPRTRKANGRGNPAFHPSQRCKISPGRANLHKYISVLTPYGA